MYSLQTLADAIETLTLALRFSMFPQYIVICFADNSQEFDIISLSIKCERMADINSREDIFWLSVNAVHQSSYSGKD